MIKIAIVVCLAALTAAEADADAFYGPYGYSNQGSNYGSNYGSNWWNNWWNNWNSMYPNSWNNMYRYNFPMRSGYRQMNYGQQMQGFQYGKRDADADAEADADAFYQPYFGNGNNMYNMNYMNNMNHMSNMNNMNYMNNMNNWNNMNY